MKHPPLIETKRLVLRPFTIDDVDLVTRYAGSEEVYANTLGMPHPYTADDAARWISGHDLKFFEGCGVESAVTLDGLLIGVVGITVVKQHNRGELGYWFGKPYWGKGYATEAAMALVRYAFDEMGLNKVTSRHFLHNPASGRVLEKAGLKHEGVLRQEYLKDGVFMDAAVFGLLRQDRSEGNDNGSCP